MSRIRTAFVTVAVGGILVAACGSGSSGTDAGTNAGTKAGSNAGARVEIPTPTKGFTLPATVVTNVGDGEKVDFSEIAPSDRPILLWFWAPH